MPSFFPNLVALDIGNTSASFHWYSDWIAGEHPRPCAAHQVATKSLHSKQCLSAVFESLFDNELPPRMTWLAASVHRAAEAQVATALKASRPTDDYHELHNSDLPLTINVEKPNQVGTDRLVAALAANHLREANRPVIIVDAGSAITVDLLSSEGVFEGGAILPGFHMAAIALADQTDALPLIDVSSLSKLPEVVGKRTEAAVQSGVVLGIVGAVKEIVNRLLVSAPQAQVFVTGGNQGELTWLDSDDWQIVDDLVPLGIVLAARYLSQSND